MLLLTLFLPLGSLYLHAYFEKGTNFVQVFPLPGGKIKNRNSMNLKDFPFQIGKSAYTVGYPQSSVSPWFPLVDLFVNLLPKWKEKGCVISRVILIEERP